MPLTSRIDITRFERDLMTPPLQVELKRADNRYESSKRIFDIFFSILILVISLPLFLLTSCLVRLNSPGPVIFSQQRIGQNRRRFNAQFGAFPERRNGNDLKGQPITIYKFRTMRMDVDPYSVTARTPEDERLTVSGKFLRTTSLDELPQFFNVLKRDLSIVGPRPEMPFIVEKYGPVEAQRLLIKPGITGLWQIYGTRKQFIHENIQYDFEYIRKRSLLLDFSILLKTIFYILKINNI
jgi:lipopolysaccharide/colanic/teichoic acid biosynthesis glycosyltransferase